MGKGGSPPPAPTQVSNITIPEYAQPYMEKLLGKTEALTERPIPLYSGVPVAGPGVGQIEAQEAIRRTQLPGGFAAAGEMSEIGGLESFRRSQYAPSQFTPMSAQAMPLQQFGMKAAQTFYRPPLSAPERFGAFQAQSYMSPYMQAVVDVQKRRAVEDARKSQLSENLASARQGTYGGARQALLQAEREKGLRESLGDIQARGLQTSFESAQQQFERDRAAQMQVQALATDVGLRTSLANLDAESQARVQNLASQLQTQGLAADAALKAALANQQQFLEAQRLQEQSRQFSGELGLKGAQALTAAGGTSADIAGRESQAEMTMRQLQLQAGQQEQAARQAQIDAQIRAFQEEQQSPYKQLGFMSDILRGTGSLAGGRAIYEAPQSFAQQAVGLGLPALALARGLS
jgi:hypothetical protein